MSDRHDRATGPRRFQPRARGGVIRTEVSDAPVVGSSTASDTVDGPKGAELDDALEKAGLSKAGSADEKRTRLAEHVAAEGEPDGTGE